MYSSSSLKERNLLACQVLLPYQAIFLPVLPYQAMTSGISLNDQKNEKKKNCKIK